MPDDKVPWSHAPSHRLASSGTYFVTASTYLQLDHFASTHRLPHQNPVKHGLVPVASQYPWCSARWFERTASAAQVKSIYRFKLDQVRLCDDFVPSGDW
jgi:hypothetical protein